MFEFGQEEDMIENQIRIKWHEVRRWFNKNRKRESPVRCSRVEYLLCVCLCPVLHVQGACLNRPDLGPWCTWCCVLRGSYCAWERLAIKGRREMGHRCRGDWAAESIQRNSEDEKNKVTVLGKIKRICWAQNYHWKKKEELISVGRYVKNKIQSL